MFLKSLHSYPVSGVARPVASRRAAGPRDTTSAAQRYVRNILVLTGDPPVTRSLLARPDHREKRLSRPSPSAFEKGERLLFGEALEQEETQQHVRLTVEFHVVHPREVHKRPGRLFRVLDRPGAVVEAPRLLPALAQGAHEETFRATRVEKRLGFGEHRREEFRGIAEKPCEGLPRVTIGPVTHQAVLEIVCVAPFAGNRDRRAQCAQPIVAVDPPPFRCARGVEQVQQALPGHAANRFR